MKAVLAFLAVLGLPLAVQAQPAPATDGSKPTALSGVTVTAANKSTEVSELVVRARKATEVSGLKVEGSCPIPATDSSWPSSWFDAPSHPKNTRTEESDGTRAFILELIADSRNGAPRLRAYGRPTGQGSP